MMFFGKSKTWPPPSLTRWLDKRSVSGSRDFKRECLVGFLAEGLEDRKHTKEAEQLIRELGTPEQQASLLISEGKVSDAVKMIKKSLSANLVWRRRSETLYGRRQAGGSGFGD